MGDSFWEKFFCKTPILERDNYEKRNQEFSQQVSSLNFQIATLEQSKADLIKAAASTAQDNLKQIDLLNGQISALQGQVQILQVQIAQGLATSLYKVPCPAWLNEVVANKVMLGQFIIKTNKGSFYITYPSPPAIFFPCPWFEQTLNAADCNRRRDDLTPIQISNKIANVCQRRRQYITDDGQWGILDNWTPGFLVTPLGGDDCESEAAEIAAGIDYYQLKFGVFKDYSVLLGLGHLKVGLQNLGHGFVVVMHNTSVKMEDSFIIEATLSYAADAKTFAEARNDYILDWGLIGYTRDTHPAGTYWMKETLAWWGGTSVRFLGARKESLLNKIKRKLLHEKSEKEIKHDRIHKIWQNKRRG
jgi:hypothetical protein